MLRTKSAVAAALCSAALVAAGAGTASAGEYKPNGEPTGARSNSNSICSYSGLNDVPEGSPDEGPGGRTQSYGQEVKLGLVDPTQFNPGDACQGGSNPARE